MDEPIRWEAAKAAADATTAASDAALLVWIKARNAAARPYVTVVERIRARAALAAARRALRDADAARDVAWAVVFSILKEE
jgi:hypothetical protein